MSDNSTIGAQKLRTSIRRQMVDLGIPPRQADETVDIAMHAAERALDTLLTTLKIASSSDVLIGATGIAVSICLDRLHHTREEMDGYAQRNGYSSATIRAGGGQ